MDEQATLILRDHGEECSFKLPDGTFRIGRQDDNDLVLDNPYISRFHVEITSDQSRHLIRDLGSTSGTFANGERITQRRLRNGDCIRLGRARGVEFVFQYSEPADEPTDSADLMPIRIIQPEETVFINTAKLPDAGELTSGTIERLRALYEFTTNLMTAESSEELSERLTAFMSQTIKADR